MCNSGTFFAAVAALTISITSQAAPLGSAFTYQGRLSLNGVEVNDDCDFEFGLWDAAGGGSEVATAIDVPNVSVDDGNFTVELDFGAAVFDGNARWLEIAVDCPAGGGMLTTLDPRQELTPSPNASFAVSAGAVDWSGLGNIPGDIADGDDVDDADSDPTNELQDLDLSGNTLSLTGDVTPVDLSEFLDDTNCSLSACNEAGVASLTCGATFIVLSCPSWRAQLAAEDNAWHSVTYGAGLFVAVASNGANPVMTSLDGINWTVRVPGAFEEWRSVTHGDGLFVSVARSGTVQVMRSANGVNWFTSAAAEANQWRSVTHGDGLFVAVASDGTNRVMTSPDGITWTARSAAEANSWQSVTHGGGLFVAVAWDGTNQVMTSPDGITWTARSAPEANAWNSVTYGGGLFVAVSGSGTNRVMTSPDGINWTARTAEASQWDSVAYGGGLFVAVAVNGTNRVMTSLDGINWASNFAPQSFWDSVTYGGGQFVAVAWSGTLRVMTSR